MRLCVCAGSSEPSMLTDTIRTVNSKKNRENFIFANNVKRHISDVKIHD